MPNPIERARLCVEDMERHRDAIARLAEMRVEAIREALDSGMSQYAVAKELGISPQAIAKILAR